MATSKLYTLKKRSSFVAARTKGTSIAGRNLVLQVLPPTTLGEDVPAGAIPVGFTATKKIGNAVTRNRAKRRMRALVQDAITSGLFQNTPHEQPCNRPAGQAVQPLEKPHGQNKDHNQEQHQEQALVQDASPAPVSGYIFIARYRVPTAPYEALQKELRWLLRQAGKAQ